jgi:hypothetical protein
MLSSADDATYLDARILLIKKKTRIGLRQTYKLPSADGPRQHLRTNPGRDRRRFHGRPDRLIRRIAKGLLIDPI